jgi:hypothetical protein
MVARNGIGIKTKDFFQSRKAGVKTPASCERRSIGNYYAPGVLHNRPQHFENRLLASSLGSLALYLRKNEITQTV